MSESEWYERLVRYSGALVMMNKQFVARKVMVIFMLCQHCKKNEATTHIKQNINGEKTEMHLCSACAQELGVMDEINSSVSMDSMFNNNFFGNLLGAGLAAMNALTGVDRCDYCGSTFNDIVNTGSVGCAHCYSRFADKLEPSIRKIHGKTRHIGKNLAYTEEKDAVNRDKAAPAADTPQKAEDESLQAQLERAVKEQRYEDAAVLRDKIKGIQPEG